MAELIERMLLVFILTGVTANEGLVQTTYNFVKTPMSWMDAQRVCRNLFTDLATIESEADLDAVIKVTPSDTGKAWIGLHDDLKNSWMWSFNDSSFYGEGEESFRNWHYNEPNNHGGKQHCVLLHSDKASSARWGDRDCSEKFWSVCFSGTVKGRSTFVMIEDKLTWPEAQSFCRENHVDLASIRNQTENEMVTSVGGRSRVWIGLYRQKVWSDGSVSLYRNGETRQSDSLGEQCVASSFQSGLWSNENCSIKLPFVCYPAVTVEDFRSTEQTESSVTLQWNKVNNNINFILQFDGTERKIRAADGDGPVTHTVSSLSAATAYNFTVFSEFEEVRSSGVSILVATAPPRITGLKLFTKNESSVTLQWNKVNNNINFILQFDGTERKIRAADGDGPVTHTVSSLSAATAYNFTVFSEFEEVRSSGVSILVATAPPRITGLKLFTKNESSVTLQWNKVNNNINFILQFDGTERKIRAADGDGPVTHTVSSLSAATAYNFTVFSEFEEVRSSGVSILVATAPPRITGLKLFTKNESSVTLQWNKVNNNITFILQIDGTERKIRAADGDGPVTHTVSSLSAATAYNFTVFSEFEEVRSSGVSILVATDSTSKDKEVLILRRIKVKFHSAVKLSASQQQAVLQKLIEKLESEQPVKVKVIS